MNKTIRGLLASTLLLVISCGTSVNAWQNPNVTIPIPQDAEHRAIVFPVDIHVGFSNKTELDAALMAGIISAGGDMVIPGQPLKPLLEGAGIGNMSWMLGEGMYHSAFVHGEAAFWDHDYTVIVNTISQLTGLVGQLLESVGVEGATPKYLLVAHIDEIGSGMIPMSEKWRVFGGLLDLDSLEIATAFYAEKTLVEDAALAEMVNVGRMLATMPFCLDQCDEMEEEARRGGWEVHRATF